MKLVYCISSHQSFGGIEVVTSLKANALSKMEGYCVWLLDSESPSAVPGLSSSNVRQIELGVRYQTVVSRFPINLLARLMKMFRHRRLIKKELMRIQPDIVISVGEEKFFLPFIKGSWKTIREIHFPKNQRQRFEQKNAVLRGLSKLGDWLEYDVVCKKYDQVVLLTEEDKRINWGNKKNLSVIPNPSRFRPDSPSCLKEKRIITIGRLAYEKDYASLIRAFSLVSKRFPDWQLDIYGEGPEYSSLLSEINSFGLMGSTCLKGTSSDIQKELLSSSIFVLSSKFEGFSLVLIEALNCGLPVLSYSCPYGPKEIITDGVNGFLVPLDDEKALAERICQLIADETLRQRMGNAAYALSERFLLEHIIKRWSALFNKLLQAQ